MIDPISAIGKHYIKVPVFARDSTGIINPTSDIVDFAFLTPEVAPVTGTTWTVGSWETIVDNGTTVYKARVLVGSQGGAITLTIGSYDVWVRIAHGAEVVPKLAGQIKVV